VTAGAGGVVEQATCASSAARHNDRRGVERMEPRE
jgi:hypothetical protein